MHVSQQGVRLYTGPETEDGGAIKPSGWTSAALEDMPNFCLPGTTNIFN